MGKLCAQVEGYNLQAATRVRANDREGLERMARYLARPPIATHRLSQLDDGRLELLSTGPRAGVGTGVSAASCATAALAERPTRTRGCPVPTASGALTTVAA